MQSDSVQTATVGSRPPRAFWTLAALGFLLAYTTWIWAGIRPSFHRVGVGTAGALLVLLVLEGRGATARAVLRDPVFHLGLAFLGYLAIQWLNAGREQYFDIGYRRWTYTDPPWRGWPSAFSRADAAQMLAWFFPAWAIAVTIRSRLIQRREMQRFMRFLAYNAGLLAVFGLVQYGSKTRAMYWVQPLQGHFFASFGYGNHVGPFFVLAGSMALGLLFREVFDVRHVHADTPSAMRPRHPVRMALLTASALLCAVGAFMGFSRTGIVLCAVLGAFAGIYLWTRAWPLLAAAGRLNLAALTLGLLGSAYFLVAGFGEQGIRKEFTLRPAAEGTLHTVWDRIDLELGGRWHYALAAAKIFGDQPLFGAGGWGFKYLVAEKVPPEFWPALETRGWANAHFDLLQFMAEFGLVGAGLLLAALAVMLRDAFRHCRCRRNAFCALAGAGLALTVGFSCLDIPFRCPAILYVWVALLAALPALDFALRTESAPRNARVARTGRTGK